MKSIYFDNNATTPVLQEVIDEMLPYFNQKFGNPLSDHHLAKYSLAAIQRARKKIAKHINSYPDEIIFTSCATESNNTVLKGIALQNLESKGHIITSSIEHKSILNPCKFLKNLGFKISYLPVDKYGRVSPDEFSQEIREDTILATIMTANNEIGTIQPLPQLTRIAHKNDIPFHTDAVQSVGKTEVDVEKSGVDFLSISAHKFYGPKGAGVLYARRGSDYYPLLHGGSHERNRRAGTHNVPNIVGMGKAIDLVHQDMDEEVERVKSLTSKLYEGLKKEISGVQLNGHPNKRLPNTLNLTFEGVDGSTLKVALDNHGIAATSGAACSESSENASHVLRSIGLPPKKTNSSVRFSLGKLNTIEDVNKALSIIPGIIRDLRG